MKRRQTLVWAVLLGVSMIGLPACGGGNKAEEGAAAPVEEEVKVDPTEKFLGTWKLAAMQSQGLTIVGDFSMMFEEDTTMVLTLSEDGVGSMAFCDDEASLSWELVDDETIALTVEQDQSEDQSEDEDSDGVEGIVGDSSTINVSYQDDGLMMSMTDEDFEGNILFTQDGTAAAYPVLAIEDGQPITSADDMVGEWKLTGMNYFGASMYGSADDLASLVGDAADTTLTISDDGTAVMMGSDVTWTVGDDGAAIDLGGLEVPVVSLNDGLAFDFSETLGMSIVMLYTK